MQNIKDTYRTIVTSYPATHKHLMLTLALFTALLWVTFSPMLPKVPQEVIAYTAPQMQSDINTQALIKKYADEEYAQMYPEATIRATTRVFKEIGVFAETINPNKQ